MKLHELLDAAQLELMMDEGRIKRQVHPELPLAVYNYTNRAQFTNLWTHEERVCRGLIVDFNDNIVARGPSKFFNYGQPGAPEVDLDAKVWVSRKEDGSLGIGWYYDGHYGVATRGSFTSDQAIKASEMLSDKAKASIKIRSKKNNLTEIFEIVYPENRIVLDYGGLSKLIVLGGVDNNSGLIARRNLGVLYGEGFSLEHEMTFAEAIALPIPDDQEGYVIDVLDNNGISGHIKLKGEQYKKLHAAIFGLSERRIWELMQLESDVLPDFIADLPDELQPWSQKVADDLREKLDYCLVEVQLAFVDAGLEFGDSLYEKENRGNVARYFIENYPDLRAPLFSMLDNKPDAVSDWAYKQIKPEHKLFRTESEDTN